MSPDRPDPARATTARQVACPGCGQPTLYVPSNPWRPFCSKRCRGVDLGAWASERYRVADAPAAPDASDDPAPRH